MSSAGIGLLFSFRFVLDFHSQLPPSIYTIQFKDLQKMWQIENNECIVFQ